MKYWQDYVDRQQGVILNLSPEETITLRAVLGRVGGCPQNSARKFADAIYDRLPATVNIGTYTGFADKFLDSKKGYVQFENIQPRVRTITIDGKEIQISEESYQALKKQFCE